MRYLFGLLLAGIVCAAQGQPAPFMTPQDTQLCLNRANVAGMFMKVRQSGTARPTPQATQDGGRNPTIPSDADMAALINEAWDKPQGQTPAARGASVRSFETQAYVDCVLERRAAQASQ